MKLAITNWATASILYSIDYYERVCNKKVKPGWHVNKKWKADHGKAATILKLAIQDKSFADIANNKDTYEFFAKFAPEVDPQVRFFIIQALPW